MERALRLDVHLSDFLNYSQTSFLDFLPCSNAADLQECPEVIDRTVCLPHRFFTIDANVCTLPSLHYTCVTIRSDLFKPLNEKGVSASYLVLDFLTERVTASTRLSYPLMRAVYVTENACDSYLKKGKRSENGKWLWVKIDGESAFREYGRAAVRPCLLVPCQCAEPQTTGCPAYHRARRGGPGSETLADVLSSACEELQGQLLNVDNLTSVNRTNCKISSRGSRGWWPPPWCLQC